MVKIKNNNYNNSLSIFTSIKIYKIYLGVPKRQFFSPDISNFVAILN